VKHFSIAAAMTGAVLLSAVTAFASPRVGRPAPAFVGQTLDGQTFDLAGLRGHVVLVNLWATWCPPCRAEMPMLDGYALAHSGEGLVLVGLSADRHRDLGEVRKAMQGLHYRAALLADAQTNGFGSPSTLPITYVIAADGAIKAVLSPADAPLTAAQLDAAAASAKN
jgi:thiol-disulfide isomerase/thioredoxin